MSTFRYFAGIFIVFLFIACQPKPKPINYGTDICYHCKMTIVDKKFAAQAVTDKGKIYNFDAIECLVQFTEQRPEMEFAYLQVKNYLKPEERLDAKKAYYLKSPDIPSPMGEFLSAYSSSTQAEQQSDHPEAVVLNWKELLEVIQSPDRR